MSLTRCLFGVLSLFALIVCLVVLTVVAARALVEKMGPRKAFTLFAGVFVASSASGLVAGGLYARKHSRSALGHFVRWVNGTPMQIQRVEDEAEDLRNSPLFSQLQNWSAETLEQYHQGKLSITPDRWPRGMDFPYPNVVKLAPEAKPEIIKQHWGERNWWGGEEPQLLILTNQTNGAEAVLIEFYYYGFAFGSPDYQPSFSPWFKKQLAPGSYAYCFQYH